MTDTAKPPPARPAAAYTTELKADHCPDCGGPVADTGTGERGCYLCGAWIPSTSETAETGS